MKVYLAARYSRRMEMLALALEVEASGHEVTSRWIKGNHLIGDDELSLGERHRQIGERYATEDLIDLANADLCICFTEEPRSIASRGGRHVELGLALGTGKRVWIVGPIENAFHCLSEIKHFDAWPACLQALEREEK